MLTKEERQERKSARNKRWAQANLQRVRTSNNEWRKAQKEAGLCVYCKNKSRPGRITCEKHKEMSRIKSKKHKEKLRDFGLCCVCAKPAIPGKTHCQRCLNKKNERGRALRKAALFRYGNACACCGETTYEFLAIDHINNNGATHRKEIGTGGSRLYVWLKNNNYPDGFQVLCHNCNQAKGHYGECPHKKMLTKEGLYDNPNPEPVASP